MPWQRHNEQKLQKILMVDGFGTEINLFLSKFHVVECPTHRIGAPRDPRGAVSSQRPLRALYFVMIVLLLFLQKQNLCPFIVLTETKFIL